MLRLYQDGLAALVPAHRPGNTPVRSPYALEVPLGDYSLRDA